MEREGRREQTDSEIEGFRLIGMVNLILTSVTDLSLSLFLLQPQAVLSLFLSRHLPHHHPISPSPHTLFPPSELYVHSLCFHPISSSARSLSPSPYG